MKKFANSKPTIKSRFEGAEGRSNRIELLLANRLIENDKPSAQLLADRGEVVEFAPADTLIVQGEADQFVYFLLAGEVDVFVNNRNVGSRGPRETVGEMTVIDPTAGRSATVKAKTHGLALKVAGPVFEEFATTLSKVWKALARTLAQRLREREKFHRPANTPPVLFIGSSTEGLKVAREVESALKHDGLEVCVWTSNVFGPSGLPVEDLLKQLERTDFALFVFGPDDKVTSRQKQRNAPRDNVVFELGLFMGKLGRHRVFVLKQHGLDIKVPSDLLGVTPLEYVLQQGAALANAISPPVNELRQAVQRLGAV